jgi:glycosyltransferase involved in cell wall biosynthesis
MARIGIDARLTYYRRGGISEYIETLIRELPALDGDHEYVILHSRKDRRSLVAGPHQRRAVCWTPAHHRIERLALAVEILPLQLDLLHSPDFIPPLGRWYKSVITIHDLTFLHYPDFLTPESRRYYNGQIRAAVARADHILADSETTKRDVIGLLRVPPEKVTTVLLAVSAHFHPAAVQEIDRFTARYSLPRGYVLFVGTFEPRKNLPGLLKAYALLRDELPDIQPLVIAGRRGWLFEEVYAQAGALGLKDHVVWIEDIVHEDMPALYSGAGVLCLPSFYEGFGLPPLEAMACGTPVVVAQRASLPEVVGDAGLLVDPDDPHSIADGLRRVLTDSVLAADRRQRGLVRAATFTWRATAQKTLAVYRQVLGRE